jgi:hypothetical protein
MAPAPQPDSQPTAKRQAGAHKDQIERQEEAEPKPKATSKRQRVARMTAADRMAAAQISALASGNAAPPPPFPAEGRGTAAEGGGTEEASGASASYRSAQANSSDTQASTGAAALASVEQEQEQEQQAKHRMAALQGAEVPTSPATRQRHQQKKKEAEVPTSPATRQRHQQQKKKGAMKAAGVAIEHSCLPLPASQSLPLLTPHLSTFPIAAAAGRKGASLSALDLLTRDEPSYMTVGKKLIPEFSTLAVGGEAYRVYSSSVM